MEQLLLQLSQTINEKDNEIKRLNDIIQSMLIENMKDKSNVCVLDHTQDISRIQETTINNTVEERLSMYINKYIDKHYVLSKETTTIKDVVLDIKQQSFYTEQLTIRDKQKLGFKWIKCLLSKIAKLHITKSKAISIHLIRKIIPGQPPMKNISTPIKEVQPKSNVSIKCEKVKPHLGLETIKDKPIKKQTRLFESEDIEQEKIIPLSDEELKQLLIEAKRIVGDDDIDIDECFNFEEELVESDYFDEN